MSWKFGLLFTIFSGFPPKFLATSRESKESTLYEKSRLFMTLSKIASHSRVTRESLASRSRVAREWLASRSRVHVTRKQTALASRTRECCNSHSSYYEWVCKHNWKSSPGWMKPNSTLMISTLSSQVSYRVVLILTWTQGYPTTSWTSQVTLQ